MLRCAVCWAMDMESGRGDRKLRSLSCHHAAPAHPCQHSAVASPPGWGTAGLSAGGEGEGAMGTAVSRLAGRQEGAKENGRE